MRPANDGDRKGGLNANVGEDVDFVHGAGMLCGAVCRGQGDQTQTNAHCGMRIFNRACECVDDCGAVGMRKRAKKRPTLCWSCARFCGQCSWSARFEPIAGWSAEEGSLTRQYGGTLKTYTVLQCPLYERDSEEDGNRRIESHAIAKAL